MEELILANQCMIMEALMSIIDSSGGNRYTAGKLLDCYYYTRKVLENSSMNTLLANGDKT